MQANDKNMHKATNQPLISFIITVYNLPVDMVKECISSVMSLSLRHDEREVIVVDDGSKEPIAPSLNEFGSEIIHIRQQNQGLSAARNAGLNVASGRYIQFVDGDDKLLRDGYEHCIDIVRRNNPDMVLFDFSYKEVKNDTFHTSKAVSGAQYMLNNNLHATACGYIFSRSILRDLRFTVGLLHEDEEFTPQLMLCAKSVYDTKAVAYFYRKRSTSIIHNSNRKMIFKRLDDIERIIFHLHAVASTLPSASRQALNRRVSQLTMDYIFNIMRLTHSPRQLETRIERLRENNLFPLPDERYTRKYTVFRRLTKRKFIRRIITFAISLPHHYDIFS